MTSQKRLKPATAATVNGLRFGQLGSVINQVSKPTYRINQQLPLSRRTAQKAEAPQSAIANHRASARTTAPSERDGLNTGRANAVQPQRFTPEQRRSVELLGGSGEMLATAAAIDRVRLRFLAEQIHSIGPLGLFELFAEAAPQPSIASNGMGALPMNMVPSSAHMAATNFHPDFLSSTKTTQDD
jgi:hypothetical protein